jgi:drug/metabolite transporter (DMT)-like permease
MSREDAATTSEVAKGDKAHINLALEVGLLTALSLIWGSSFTLMKLAVETIPPLTMTAARVGMAALLLVLIARTLGLTLPRERPIWAAFFVQGLLQSALPFTLISWGEKHIASGLAGVLNATPPIFVLLIAGATRHGGHRVTAQKIVGAGLGLAGVLVTIGVESLRDFNTAAPPAQAAVLGASLCYALAPIWGQRFSAVPPVVTAAGAMSCAALMLLPAALIVERSWTLASGAGSDRSGDRPCRAVYGHRDDHLFSPGANPWRAWNQQRQLPSRRLFGGARHPLSRRKFCLVDFRRNGADLSRRHRRDRD